MKRIETVLRDAMELSNIERAELIERLRQSAPASDFDAEEIGVGRGGLAALKESTVGEDWSAYYPPELLPNRDA